MSIGVESDADIRMPHQILKHLRIHSGLCHIRAVRVSAYMRCDLRKLNAINAVILINCVLEVLLPVHSHHWLIVLVKAKEA